MARHRIISEIDTYGIYEGWDSSSKELPRIRSFTHEIPARVGIEFGYILRIQKARGKKLSFAIHHPPFTDAEGKVMPSFTGEHHIHKNDWRFFLGDCIWSPPEDKVGPWRLMVEMEGESLADETFHVVSEVDSAPESQDKL